MPKRILGPFYWWRNWLGKHPSNLRMQWTPWKERNDYTFEEVEAWLFKWSQHSQFVDAGAFKPKAKKAK